jgi:uncharacterized membrane protein YhhN
MSMFENTLTGLALVSATLTIHAKYKGLSCRVWVFKPLTMAFVLSIALTSGGSRPSLYFLLIVTGLLLSLAGDVFLMLPKDRFIFGLTAFLIAHGFYISAFTWDYGFDLTWWIVLPVLIAGTVLLFYLLPHAGRMRRPVVLYVIVILTMVWQAWERWNRTRQAGSLLAAAGAALFLVSDSLLAWNRFRQSFKSAEALKLSSYFVAQWLIARSV